MTPQQLPSGQVSPTLAAIWPSFSGVVASVSSQLQSKPLQSTRNQIQSPLLLYLQEKWYTVGLHNEITLGGNALKRLNILYIMPQTIQTSLTCQVLGEGGEVGENSW